jgi:hypothetical protein
MVRGSCTSLKKTQGQSMARKDGDAESHEPGRREKAEVSMREERIEDRVVRSRALQGWVGRSKGGKIDNGETGKNEEDKKKKEKNP